MKTHVKIQMPCKVVFSFGVTDHTNFIDECDEFAYFNWCNRTGDFRNKTRLLTSRLCCYPCLDGGGGGRFRPLCKFFQGAWLCKHGGVAGHFILLSLMSNSRTVVCSGGWSIPWRDNYLFTGFLTFLRKQFDKVPWLIRAASPWFYAWQ